MLSVIARHEEAVFLQRSAFFGALAGVVVALLDFASTVLWLHARRDQLELLVALGLLGSFAGGFFGLLVAVLQIAISRDAVHTRRQLVRTSTVVAVAVAPVAWMLFSGPRMQRLPWVPLWRLSAWLLVTVLGVSLLAVSAKAYRSRPRAVAAVSAVMMLLLHAVDHRAFARLYGYLHASLSLATWACAAIVVSVVADKSLTFLNRPLSASAAAARVCAWAAVGLAGLGLLHRNENVRAEVFATHAPFVRTIASPLQPLLVRVARMQQGRRRFIAYGERRSTSAETRQLDEQFRSSRGANVLLVTVDALRNDTLSPARFARLFAALSPHGIVRFATTYTPAPHSSFAITSLHTGTYLHETVADGRARTVPTLAEHLTAAGYRSVGIFPPGIFFTQGEALRHYRDERLGFARVENRTLSAQDVTRVAIEELDQSAQRGEAHTFLWAHYFDMHEPYAGAGQTERQRYLNAATVVDQAAAALVRHALAQRGLPWIVVVSADHGEEFGEHGGVYHGSSVYEEQVRVPLLLSGPGIGDGVVSQPVSLVDVAPTLVALTHVSVATAWSGRDLRPLMPRALSDGLPPSVPVFSAVNSKHMIVDGHLKLIADEQWNTHQLFDLSTDPAERSNLASEQPTEVLRLAATVAGWRDAMNVTPIVRDRRGCEVAVALALRTSADRADTIRTLRSLRHSHDDACLRPLTTLLAQEPPTVAGWAAVVLANIREPTAQELLRRSLSTDDSALNAAAAEALSYYQDTLALPTLTASLTTADESQTLVNLAAIERIGVVDSSTCAAVLSLLDNDHVRYRAVLSASVACGLSADAVLERIALHDRASDVRAWAIAALGRSASERGAAFIAERLLQDDAAQLYGASALTRALSSGVRLPQWAAWDARAGRGAGWTRCERDSDDQPWVALDARGCESAGEAAATVVVSADFGRGPLRAWLRARGAAALRVVMNTQEVARLRLEPATREWRIDMDGTALREGENTLQFFSDSPFALSHFLLRTAAPAHK
jgi:arylsulfatase A-like enzyme